MRIRFTDTRPLTDRLSSLDPETLAEYRDNAAAAELAVLYPEPE